MAQKTFSIIQIIISVLLVVSILLQQRGAELGSLFGGSGGDNVYRSKRGIEKFLFRATIVLAALFLGTAFAGMIL